VIRPSRPHRYAAVLLGALLGVLVGCGGNGALSISEYRTQVRAICRDTSRRTGKLHVPDANDAAALVRLGRRTVAIQRAALHSIRALDAPESRRARVDQWLGLVARTIDSADSSLRAQERGDLAAATSANTTGAAVAIRADAIARDLGVATCVTTAAAG
jgi:hypothetical protein